nr:MAG TPA: hypothetical protein [Bacteriophage sp.]
MFACIRRYVSTVGCYFFFLLPLPPFPQPITTTIWTNVHERQSRELPEGVYYSFFYSSFLKETTLKNREKIVHSCRSTVVFLYQSDIQ